MHQASRFVGVKLLAVAAALGVVAWASTDGEVSAQSKQQLRHPHLHRALHELRQAHHNLKEAHGHFGGHRSEALRDVDRAIRQVERAMHNTQQNGTRRKTGVGGITTKSIGTGSTSPTRGSGGGVLIIPQK